MRNLKLLIAYDGTDFSGWQRQPGERTVQQVLEEALAPLNLGAEPSTIASGRTDAGVHSLGQIVQFYTVARHPPATYVKALNATLPGDVRVLDAEDVPQSFHATVDATSKRYRYVFDNGPYADPFRTRYAWHVYQKLNADVMHEGAQHLVGRHDFHSFETNWPNRSSSVRTIFDIEVRRSGPIVTLEVEADGFLYNMVRSIAGTLFYVGFGKWSPAHVATILAAEDRVEAGPTAPPQGLFQVKVYYP